MSVTHTCENGHERETHRTHPDGHGSKPVCIECKADIIERSVPLFECDDCGNVWGYTGDAETPTCSNCRGKRTAPVADD